MDTNKQPGIVVNKIRLYKSEFFLSDIFFTTKTERGKGIKFHLDKEKDDSGNLTGNLRFGVSIKENVEEKTVLFIKVIFQGEFRYENNEEINLDMESFLNSNAPAIIYPFIRSHISNLTIQAGMPAIVLPILNLPAIMSDMIKNELKKSAENKSE
jgi:preprotein translocase subunit SecB